MDGVRNFCVTWEILAWRGIFFFGLVIVKLTYHPSSEKTDDPPLPIQAFDRVGFKGMGPGGSILYSHEKYQLGYGRGLRF